MSHVAQFQFPMTIFEQDRYGLANAAARAVLSVVQADAADFELYTDQVPPAKLPHVIRALSGDELVTDVMGTDYLRRLLPRAMRIARSRGTVRSHLLLAEALLVSYSSRLTAGSLTVNLVPTTGVEFDAGQLAYVRQAYRWLTPVATPLTVRVVEEFNLRVRPVMAHRRKVLHV